MATALLKIIPQFRPDSAVAYVAILYAAPQHVDAFARYLDDHSGVRVKRAIDGEPVEGGVCYLGAGVEYLTVAAHSGRLMLQVHRAPFASRRGSIDRLMFSVAEAMKGRAVGVVLSGSGRMAARVWRNSSHGRGRHHCKTRKAVCIRAWRKPRWPVPTRLRAFGCQNRNRR